MRSLVAALSWNPEVRGGLYVLISLVVLPGSAYLLMATNIGSRLGFQLAAAGFFGWMAVMGMVWWVYGIGLTGPAGHWKPQATVVGDVAARATDAALARFPREWEKLELTDPAVADAIPVVDGVLVPPPESTRQGMFESPNDYIPLAAYEKGGRAFGPLGLDFRPFNVFHTPHYIAVQVQKAVKPPAAPGQPPPRPVPDPGAPPVTVALVRDLGAVRLYPAVVALSSLTLFGLSAYRLHRWDRDAMARGAEKSKT